VLEQVATERAGRLKVVKLNTDEQPDIGARYAIRSIPTMLLFRGPLTVDQMVGALSKGMLDARLDAKR
jgi:thioredoxin-like negative regulator of GroEL